MLSEDGFAKPSLPKYWKGENGLYCVGLARKGFYGAAMDAKNVAHDIKAQLLHWTVSIFSLISFFLHLYSHLKFSSRNLNLWILNNFFLVKYLLCGMTSTSIKVVNWVLLKLWLLSIDFVFGRQSSRVPNLVMVSRNYSNFLPLWLK